MAPTTTQLHLLRALVRAVLEGSETKLNASSMISKKHLEKDDVTRIQVSGGWLGSHLHEAS